ncbi:MAG: hypothetical protein A2365_03675 [Candidatus Nealsonbacteria bacterium RIFOXYB1_FULL_40_15]|uniref:Uncharacterized protein n=1 Tax=Candidatus Nealsonbacteria bacterium RIFOXYB1_FULL_40_15 TaxID=1801677 RepID=A0A1G2EPJ4_9BACT|nr:MAG: hypothetical protein A2365_03675 [Candidatus Nealsonbacteria bacterium RIFOXYB1_FULL_40_15]OGZ29525.1 MAG: hypothetical protein A2562_02445 [Candidatus Nealsonbacteria bacterium RIFOXYD1_FULL_39_11]
MGRIRLEKVRAAKGAIARGNYPDRQLAGTEKVVDSVLAVIRHTAPKDWGQRHDANVIALQDQLPD